MLQGSFDLRQYSLSDVAYDLVQCILASVSSLLL